MKHTEKFSAFETNGGKYSARKIPQWRMGHHELREYLDFLNAESEELGSGFSGG
jgi:hypothetical protein